MDFNKPKKTKLVEVKTHKMHTFLHTSVDSTYFRNGVSDLFGTEYIRFKLHTNLRLHGFSSKPKFMLGKTKDSLGV